MNELVAARLTKKFRDRTVLDGVSIRVGSGEIVGLLGPNGAGKTTCFYTIVGLLKPDDGDIQMNGDNIIPLPIHRRATMGLAYLPQEKSVFSDLTALENVQAVLEIRGGGDDNNKKAKKLLRDMGVAHLANNNAGTLSGGERRRVEIARLLAMSPKFVLMDEPFAAIAPIAVNDLQKIIFSLRARGIGIFITDHNVRDTLKICDRAYIMDQGKVLVEGAPDVIVADKSAKTIYFGDNFGI